MLHNHIQNHLKQVSDTSNVFLWWAVTEKINPSRISLKRLRVEAPLCEVRIKHDLRKRLNQSVYNLTSNHNLALRNYWLWKRIFPYKLSK